MLNNFYDWDMFYTYFEIDLRSWTVDKTLPLWSYQFCGGSTRIGDPQAFGLSPLFIINILFGTIIGTKLQVFFASIWGFIFFRKILLLFTHDQYLHSKYEKKILDFVTLATIFSNYFGFSFVFCGGMRMAGTRRRGETR